uniref:Uncharacterized protein n=1 Tax=Scophthalmus maximus TaxID=52904 RepID=A0A8D3DPZ8_SCOMX
MDKDSLYSSVFLSADCEACLALFQDQSDPANLAGPSFILDFPTSVGVPQRALLTLPYGLTIGRSSIPGAGVGVINHGPMVSVVLILFYLLQIYKGEHEYEYIDAARESHSNWMRYVNCARDKDETNLLAVPYKGSLLYHCCRAINPGDELMVWPSKESELVETDETKQMNASENPQEAMDVTETENPSAGEAETPQSTCSDCGKSFTNEASLRKHKATVHERLRPYVCTVCQKCFGQYNDLTRHLRLHQNETKKKEKSSPQHSTEAHGREALQLPRVLQELQPPTESQSPSDAAHGTEDVQMHPVRKELLEKLSPQETPSEDAPVIT